MDDQEEFIAELNQALAATPMPSEIAPTESTSLLPVVGSGGGVGLRSSEAEDLAREWVERSNKCKEREADAMADGLHSLALCNEVRAVAYLLCAHELRLRAGLPIPRQPEPND